jgi:hypothetical protein
MFHSSRLLLIALAMGMFIFMTGCTPDRPASPNRNGDRTTGAPVTEPSHDAPPRSPAY